MASHAVGEHPLNGDLSNTKETGREPGAPSGAEPSAAEASRLLARRLAREETVVAHGTIPFRSGPGPERPRRRYLRFALVMVVGLAAAVVLSVVVVLAIAVVAG